MMQSAKDLAAYIGRLGQLTRGGWSFPVVVVDARSVYGETQFEVEGSHGNGVEGREWVRSSAVKFPFPSERGA